MVKTNMNPSMVNMEKNTNRLDLSIEERQVILVFFFVQIIFGTVVGNTPITNP